MEKQIVKALIVFAPATFNLAETTRMIEIAKELRPNYDCRFYGFSTKYFDLITKNGFEGCLLEPIFSAEQEQQLIKLDQLKGIKNPFKTDLVRKRVKSELTYLANLKPQVIVTGTNLTVFLSARIAKIPLVYVKPIAYSRPYLENKKVLPPLALSKPYLPTRLLWQGLRYLMLNMTYKPKAFSKVASDYHLKLPKKTIDLIDGDHNFITTLPIFTNDLQFPSNYHTIGPVFAKLSDTLSVELQSILERAQAEKRMIIYFAVGSSGNAKLVTMVLRVLEKLKVTVIAPVKQYVGSSWQTDQESQIVVTDFVPAHLLAPYITFSVIHGGEGTVQTACLSGKPFIGFGLQAEQEINLQQCQQFSNGLQIKLSQLSEASLIAGIEKIQEKNYQEKARKMKALMTAEVAGAQQAARLISALYF